MFNFSFVIYQIYVICELKFNATQCFNENSFPRERSSRKTVSFEEQILSRGKYPSTFSRQMEAIVFIILEIFFAKRAVLKTGEIYLGILSFSRRIFIHVTRLDQSRASENIRWIIMRDIGMKVHLF